MFAQDPIDIARAKKKAFEQLFQQNEHLFKQGEGTRTDILEAESRYELAMAEEIQALDEQDASLRELGALIGMPSVNISDLVPLNAEFATFTLTSANYDTWHELTLTNNPTLASQRQTLEVARYGVERNRVGHLPRVTAYATSGGKSRTRATSTTSATTPTLSAWKSACRSMPVAASRPLPAR